MDAYVKSMGYDRERDIDKVRLGLHEGGTTGSSGWRSFCPVALRNSLSYCPCSPRLSFHTTFCVTLSVASS